MKRTLQILSLILFSTLHSQTPNVIWSKYFGGTLGNATEATSIQKTTDGGYIVAGRISGTHPEAANYHDDGNSNYYPDGFVVKLDSNFVLQWSNCYGTIYNESIRQIKPTSDGGYIFVGEAFVASQGNNFWIVKINATGNVLWEKKYGGTGTDNAENVVEKIGGGYLVSGTSTSSNGNVTSNFGYTDYWVINIDSNGNLVSNANFGGTSNDDCHGLVANPDGTYVVAGEAASYTGQVTCRTPAFCESSYWIAKIGNTDNILWTQCVGPLSSGSNLFCTPYDMIKTSDNGYILVGRGNDNTNGNTYGASDVWVVKLDSNGYVVWRENYGGSDNEYGYAIKETTDGGYIIVGDSYSSDGNVTVTLTGYSQDNGWIFKINSTGVLQWQKTVGSSNFGNDYFNDVIQIGPNEYVAAGKAGLSNGDCIDSNGRRFWITKIATTALGIATSTSSRFDIEVYPNPTNNIVNYKTNEVVKTVSINDISGRKVLEVSSDNITKTDISTLAKGVYVVTISNGYFSTTKKIIKE
jgi:hypothetical protein